MFRAGPLSEKPFQDELYALYRVHFILRRLLMIAYKIFGLRVIVPFY